MKTMSNLSKAKKSLISPEAIVLLEILRHIQKIDSEFPIQYAICLIEISENEGCSVTNLAELCGIPLSTVSRIIGALSDYRQLGNPYHFIEVKVSPSERRKKELYLTQKGRAALKEILSPLKK